MEPEELEQEEEIEPIQGDEPDLVGMCGDCLTVLPDRQVENDVFYKAGRQAVCRYCGGPVVVARLRDIEAVRRKRRRGDML